MKKTIQRYLTYYLIKTPWNFCWRIAVDVLLITLILTISLSFFMEEETATFPESFWFLIFGALVLAPILETVFLQMIPIMLLQNFSKKLQIIVPALLFSLLHLANGIVAAISVGFVGGVAWAFTYQYWSQHSIKLGLAVTAGAHFIHNSAIICILVITGQVVI